MRQLTLMAPRKIKWQSVPEPVLGGPLEALVRPVIASRCDGDNLPIFKRVTSAMRAGVALHYLDPIMTDAFGSRPFAPPYALGHECIARVTECGESVETVRPGQLVIVPWTISCGSCGRCVEGLTARCSEAGDTLLSGYGFGPGMGSWGGAVSDLLRVPYADAMLVPVPPNIDPMKLASASDNLPDAWRTVGPPLRRYPHASVLVVGGSARSIGLYSAGMAVALGASRVDYVDHDTERLEIAERLGAHPIQRERGSRWFIRNAPRVHGTFRVTVEASSTAEGLRYALRSMAPGGICTAVGYYLAKKTGVPLLQMYVNDAALKIGISHTRANLPEVIALVGEGKFDPTIVTTLVADWNDAPDAFATPTTKVVVKRSE